MRIKSQSDFFSGLMFAALGAAFAVGATAYRIGDGIDMGPGYFPLLLGILLAALGVAVMFQSLVVEKLDGEPTVRWAWKPLFFVVAANLAFGALLGGLPDLGLPSMGLVAATYALTILASLAGARFRLGQVLLLSTVLAAACVALIWLMKLPIPAWPAFVAG